MLVASVKTLPVRAKKQMRTKTRRQGRADRSKEGLRNIATLCVWSFVSDSSVGSVLLDISLTYRRRSSAHGRRGARLEMTLDVAKIREYWQILQMRVCRFPLECSATMRRLSGILSPVNPRWQPPHKARSRTNRHNVLALRLASLSILVAACVSRLQPI